MKKLIVGILALTLFIGTSVAQTPVELIAKAKKAVKGIGGKKEKVKDAETAVAAMLEAAENKTNWEALLIAGKLQNELVSIDNLERAKQQLLGKPYKSEFTLAPSKASEYFMQAAKGTQDKKQLKEITTALSEAQAMLNTAASELTDAKDYVGAYNLFKQGLDVHSVLKANGVKSVLDKEDEYNKQLYLTALLSTYADKEKDCVDIYKKMIEVKKDTTFVYASLYKALVDTDKEQAFKYLEMGSKKYPDDTQIMFTMINYYLKENKLELLVGQLKEAIKREPKNTSLYFTLGNVFDNLAQAENDPAKQQSYSDQAQDYYRKTLEIDAKNVDAIYSIGAAFYNKAAAFSKEMKKYESDMSKEGTKKYDAAEKNMIAEFDKALPFFKKAESINPNDQNTLIALKEIFARKNDLKMAGEIKTRLETVQNGGKNKESLFKE
jgi:hypothetical protein